APPPAGPTAPGSFRFLRSAPRGRLSMSGPVVAWVSSSRAAPALASARLRRTTIPSSRRSLAHVPLATARGKIHGNHHPRGVRTPARRARGALAPAPAGRGQGPGGGGGRRRPQRECRVQLPQEAIGRDRPPGPLPEQAPGGAEGGRGPAGG